MTGANKRGGPNRGQGRKALTTGAASVVVTVRMTPSQRDRFRLLGGGKWIREMVDKTLDKR